MTKAIRVFFISIALFLSSNNVLAGDVEVVTVEGIYLGPSYTYYVSFTGSYSGPSGCFGCSGHDDWLVPSYEEEWEIWNDAIYECQQAVDSLYDGCADGIRELATQVGWACSGIAATLAAFGATNQLVLAAVAGCIVGSHYSYNKAQDWCNEAKIKEHGKCGDDPFGYTPGS